MFHSSWNWFCGGFFAEYFSALSMSFLLFHKVLFIFPLQVASTVKVRIDFSKLLFLSTKLGKRNVCFLHVHNVFAGGKNDIVIWKNGEANSI